MAIGLSITEFGGAHRRYHTQCADATDIIACQAVAAAGSSAALSSATYMVRLCGDTAMSIAFSNSQVPTASTTTTFLPANVPEYFTVRPGITISWVANT